MWYLVSNGNLYYITILRYHSSNYDVIKAPEYLNIKNTKKKYSQTSFPVDRRAEAEHGAGLTCSAELLGLSMVKLAQHLWLKSISFMSGIKTAQSS